MPHGAEVRVHLTSENVEGTKRDTIIASTIASRPEIRFDISGNAYCNCKEMKLTDADNHIYTADGLNFGSDIAFRRQKGIFSFLDTSSSQIILKPLPKMALVFLRLALRPHGTGW